VEDVTWDEQLVQEWDHTMGDWVVYDRIDDLVDHVVPAEMQPVAPAETLQEGGAEEFDARGRVKQKSLWERWQGGDYTGRNRPQDRMRVEGQTTRQFYDTVPDIRPPDQNDPLRRKALDTANRALFPHEAGCTQPKGYYADWWEAELYAQGRQQPEHPVTQRDFVARASHDGIILKAVLSKCLSKQPVALAWIGEWASTLETCFTRKPDLRFYGYVPIPVGEFEKKFESSNAFFLHDMCEKHHGESICLCYIEGGECKNPRVANQHHPQFFVYSHRDPVAKHAMVEAARLMEYSKKCSNGRTWTNAQVGTPLFHDFLDFQESIPNSVYSPIGEGMCRQVEVAYHTLPSLIYECCGEANLLDIYTFFCTCRLLTAKAPHSRSLSNRKPFP
jgi:hypothetical protein